MLKFQDFEGQARAEKYSRVIITLFGAVGLIWGYIIQQFSQTVYILAAGFILAAVVSDFHKYYKSQYCTVKHFQLTIPPWPMYRRRPLQWQKVRSSGEANESKKGKKK